jgi:hypothetical protein
MLLFAMRTPPHRWARALGGRKLAVLIVVAALAAVAAPSALGSVTIGSPEAVAGSADFLGVTCPSATTCLAVGKTTGGGVATGAVVSIVNGVPGAVQGVKETFELDGVACSTATSCVAVGYRAFVGAVVVPIVNGVAGSATLVASPVERLGGVACTSATTCIAAGVNNASPNQGIVVPIVNGAAGTPQAVAGAYSLSHVACASATTCWAAGNNHENGGVVAKVTNGVAGGAGSVGGTFFLAGVACPSASTCEVVGESLTAAGVVVPIVNGVIGSTQAVEGTFTLAGAGCASATDCLAVGSTPPPNKGTGVVVPVTSGVSGTAQPVTGTFSLNAVACTSVTKCVAVGTNSTNGLLVPITLSAALTKPVVTQQPASMTVTAGQPVSFTASASGNPTPTVQWQLSKGGGAFANLSGATSTTLTIPSTEASESGNRFQAVFSNSQGTATSEPATLTVNPASQSPPELGRCVKTAKGAGKYSGATCISQKAGGSYEWLPGVAKKKFTSKLTEGVATLETVKGSKVVCKTETTTGEYSGLKTVANVVLTLTGCERLGEKCSSAKAAAGKVVTKTLDGALGIEKLGKTSVANKIGLDLFPVGKTGAVVEFSCGTTPVSLTGSIIVPVSVNVMQLTSKLNYSASKGKQKPEGFVGEPKDILEASFNKAPFEQTGLTLKTTQTNEETVEISSVV